QKLVKEKGDIIHTVFNQTLTATGRLSSSEPNLQNIPIRDEEGKYLRKLFISSFDGGKIVTADYNQIELRLLANMSGDETLIHTFNHGKDIHSATAAQIFSKDIDQISPKERSMAKAVNFGIVYGMSPYGLAEQINITPKQAREFMDKYFQTYPKVPIYMNSNIEFARKNGYVKTLYGRIRKINEISASNKMTQQFGERVAMNMPLQGTASDIIKLAMIMVDGELKKQNLQSKLILQIHDELIVDTHQNEQQQVEKILKDCMESVADLSVPLVVKIESGNTWYDAK
ncbi:MAG: DNA polymerase I, partial [Clostridia bacterium]|nr:DNA polymerase I [Clostridia bacterium]